MKFIQARWYTKGPRKVPITLVVIHDAEYPEKLNAAVAVARFFASTDRKASAHYTADDTSVVQSVKEEDIAYHAPGANHNGIGIEHAGYARQTTAEWLDPYSTQMLRDQSAPLVRDICTRHGIPLVWLSVDDLRAGKHGITSHNNVSLCWHQSSHTDPGPNFPIAQFMKWVGAGPPPSPIPPPILIEDDPMEIFVPVGQGSPDVGTQFARFGEVCIGLRSVADLQQLANTYANGDINKLPRREVEPGLWQLIRAGLKFT